MTDPTPAHTTADLYESQEDRGVRRAARGSALNLFGAGVSAVATFGLTAVVTHGTTKASAGVFFSATSVFVLLVSVAQLGTYNGLVYFLARAKALDRADMQRSYWRAALWPVLWCSVAMGATLLVLAPQVASLVTRDNQELAVESVRVLAWFIPFASLENLVVSASRGLGTMRPNTIVEQILRPGLQILVAAIILFTNMQLNLSWAWAVPYAIAGLVGWIWLRRLLVRESPEDVRETVAGEFWRFTAPRSVAGVSQVALQRLDIVLVGALAGAPAAAVYTAATRFVVLGQMTRTAVSRAIQPHLAAAMTNGTPGAVKRLYQVSTAWLMAVSWPIYLVMLADAPSLLNIFGHSYAVASDVLIFLALSMLVATFCGDVDVMLIMSGRTVWSMINISIALGVNIALDVWLIPIAGIRGAAIGWAVAIVVKNLTALVQIALIFRVQPVGRGTVVVALSAVVSFFGIVVGARAVLGESLVGLLVGGALGCVVYGALLWSFRGDIELQAFLHRRSTGRSLPVVDG